LIRHTFAITDIPLDRDDRAKEAFVTHCAGKILPADRVTKPEEDLPYLASYLAQVNPTPFHLS
jgi:hypothetical protein